MPADRFDTGFDTVIAGGAVVSHRGVEVMDLGLRDGRIAALAGPGALVIMSWPFWVTSGRCAGRAAPPSSVLSPDCFPVTAFGSGIR